MKFDNYIEPNTVEEAFEWAKQPDTVILGGLMWLRMQKRTVKNAVDLSKLGLDEIEKTDEGIRIGAYVTLRELETSPIFSGYSKDANKSALSQIVGVQFRNTATVGGSVFGRFGFSDVATLFTALGASVCLAGQGTVPMQDFIRDGAKNDLLTHIILPKSLPDGAVAMSERNTATDFPVVTAAVCRRGDIIRVTISPAPIRGETREYSAAEFSEIPDLLQSELSFRSDRSASAEYRAHIARVLVKRALERIGG